MMVLILRKKQIGQGCVCFQRRKVRKSEETLQLKHFRKYGCQSPRKIPPTFVCFKFQPRYV